MPTAPMRQARIATTSQTSKRSSNDVQPSQALLKKMPQSEKFAEVRNGTTEILNDVVFLRLPAVKALTGLSKTSLYALIKDKSFPAPVHLGPRAVAWVKSEIRQWAQERVQASRSVA